MRRLPVAGRERRPSEGPSGGRAVPDRRARLEYLPAGGGAALLPAPGALGSLGAALVPMLTVAGLLGCWGAGVPGATAVSAVFDCQLLTAWLPLFPGLLVLGLLVRSSGP
ncbi:hypothetical protein ACFY2V_28100 [Streptomyces eurythermus]|uniref:hypothetical protein n=1 Tax=Streptomyces eurythermus TaxID=42237 RepID=UPI0036849F09